MAGFIKTQLSALLSKIIYLNLLHDAFPLFFFLLTSSSFSLFHWAQTSPLCAMSTSQFTLVSLLCFSSCTLDLDLTGFLSHLLEAVHSKQHECRTQVQLGPHSSQSQWKASRLTRWSETDQANWDSWSRDRRGRERDQTEIRFLNSGGVFNDRQQITMSGICNRGGEKPRGHTFKPALHLNFILFWYIPH